MTEDWFTDTHLHEWSEKRVTAIQLTCACGAVEWMSNHRGVLKGSHHRKSSRRKTEPVRRMAVDRPVKRRPKQRRGEQNPERAAEIVRLRTEEHLSYEELGQRYGVSRERIRQVLARAGVDLRQSYHERMLATAKKYQPPCCPRCGEPYGDESGQAHWRRLHGMRPEWIARDQALAADYAAGMRVEDIQAKHHVGPTAITRAARRLGVPLRRPNGNFLKTTAEVNAREEAIAADLRSGEPSREIAAKYAVSAAWVYLVAKKYGLIEPGRPRSRITAAERDSLRALRAQGMSINAIARQSGRTFNAVKKAVA